ncbi:MAG: hypothetical protein AAGM36_14310 [Cyanobacteria bacterium J06597_1]
MNDLQKYRLRCTLTFGDIYGQIVVWLLVIFASLAAALASMAGSSQPLYALATVALVLVVTLPFLLFAFVTTLFNHIEAMPAEVSATKPASKTNAVPTSSAASAGA